MTRSRDFSTEQVVADIRTLDGRSYSGIVLRTYVHGDGFEVDVRFAVEHPRLKEGEDIVIAFSGHRISGRPTTRSRWVTGVEGLDPRCERFRVSMCVRGSVGALAERRSAERVVVADGSTVELRLEDEEEPMTVSGVLDDLSSTGLKFSFATRRAPVLEVGDPVTISFYLPGSDEPFCFRAEIRSRSWSAGRGSYGVAFQRESSKQYRTLEGRLFGALIDLACKVA